MIYQYRAKKGPQGIEEGRLEADTEKEAIEKLSAMGYVPVRIEPLKQDVTRQAVVVTSSLGRIRVREVTIFSRELASLIKSGLPILNAMTIILEQSENPSFRRVLENIRSSLKDGNTFSAALSSYPKIFPTLYLSLIRAGEDSGSLPEALLRIADYRLKEEEAYSRLRMALAYPLLMVLVGLGTIIFMLTFVIPRLAGIFFNLGQRLPLPTRILIKASTSLSHWWIWTVLILAVLISRKQFRSEPGKQVLSRFKLALPLFGNLILKSELSRFSRTLELLLKSGIPILRAIALAIPVIDNEVIKGQLRISYQELEQGGSFGKSLKNSRLFPLFMTNLLIVGEESGRLNESLSEVARTYERDTEEAFKVMTNLLEPLLILVMGLVIGFIVVAMLLPVFEINVAVH
ncbi:MAG TPA: type II secretion system F family protein [Candidatus Margulisiibacteriota bacterium]|nr:type II secretion system F family protein [Candidatus Margulisiibacteriota bacterium]